MFALLTDSTKPIQVKGSRLENLGGQVLAAGNSSWPDPKLEPGSNWSSVSFFSVGVDFQLRAPDQSRGFFLLNDHLGPVFLSTLAYSPDGRWFAVTTAERISTRGRLGLFPDPPYARASAR
jgi:hypothetical protein